MKTFDLSKVPRRTDVHDKIDIISDNLAVVLDLINAPGAGGN